VYLDHRPMFEFNNECYIIRKVNGKVPPSAAVPPARVCCRKPSMERASSSDGVARSSRTGILAVTGDGRRILPVIHPSGRSL